jgi:quercetin dioxygenase-like cupin family protein
VRLIDFREPRAEAVDRYGSREAAFARIAVTHGDGHLSCMYLGPGGCLGRHPAPCPQLFCVLAGAGTVTGGDGVPRLIESGRAVLFDAGEDHESSTTEGMDVLVLGVSATIQSAAR